MQCDTLKTCVTEKDARRKVVRYESFGLFVKESFANKKGLAGREKTLFYMDTFFMSTKEGFASGLNHTLTCIVKFSLKEKEVNKRLHHVDT